MLWAIVEEFEYMWRNLGVCGGDCGRIWVYVEEIRYYGRLWRSLGICEGIWVDVEEIVCGSDMILWAIVEEFEDLNSSTMTHNVQSRSHISKLLHM